MNLRELLQSDKKLKQESNSNDLAFLMSRRIHLARIVSGLTQEQLAKRMKTKQSNIARIEAGNSLPSLKYLEEIANALNTKLSLPNFDCVEKHQAKKILHFAVDMLKEDKFENSLYESCIVSDQKVQQNDTASPLVIS